MRKVLQIDKIFPPEADRDINILKKVKILATEAGYSCQFSGKLSNFKLTVNRG